MKPESENREQTGDENCSTCASGQQQGVPTGLPPKAKIDVKHVILVLSGKGGVGKSTVSVNLVYALASHGKKVGLLDLDFHGPISQDAGDRRPATDGSCKNHRTCACDRNLAVMSMAFLLPDKSTPVVWRGPMKMGAIQQFLTEVNWGALDYLVVDLPPGTGDEALTIVQLAPNVRGAVIVTTPQDVAVLDAIKAAKFIEKLDLPILGVIENMSGMVCPHCGGTINLFSVGGGKKAAGDLGVPFLGAIPLDPEMVKASDEGRPYILHHVDSPTWSAMNAVMVNLIEKVEY